MKYYRVVKTDEAQPLLSTRWNAEKCCKIPKANPIQNIISYEVLNAKWKLLLNDMYIHVCLVVQLSPAVSHPMDCSLPGSSVHGILQARILEWVPFPPPGDPSHPGFEPRSPALQQTLYHLGHQGSPGDRYMDGKLNIKTRYLVCLVNGENRERIQWEAQAHRSLSKYWQCWSGWWVQKY